MKTKGDYIVHTLLRRMGRIDKRFEHGAIVELLTGEIIIASDCFMRSATAEEIERAKQDRAIVSDAMGNIDHAALNALRESVSRL